MQSRTTGPKGTCLLKHCMLEYLYERTREKVFPFGLEVPTIDNPSVTLLEEQTYRNKCRL